MNNMMKILSRVVLIAAFGILFSFMSKTEVKADAPDCTASITAPAELVKGQDYDIQIIFTFNCEITAENRGSTNYMTSVGYADGLPVTDGGTTENGNIVTFTESVHVPLDTTLTSFYFYGRFGSTEKARVTIPIVAPPTYTVTFEPNGGNFNGSTTAATRTTGTDGTLTAFPEVQRNGFTFDGWFDDAADPNTAVRLDKVYSSATTLTAHWTETPSYHTVTYHVVNGKWNDESTADKTEGDILHGSSPIHVPAVGSIPNSGYKAGSWDTNPSTAIITANRTFTYTYASDTPAPTRYKVTLTTDGHGEAYVNKRSGVSGTKFILKELPDDGYRFKQWEVVSVGVELDNYRDYTTSFTIKNADVEIKAHFEKKEEHTRENDYGPEESKSEAAWTPEKAAATIAAEKAEKQQAAGTQLVSIQTMLRTKTSDRAGTGRNVIDLDMTKVDILDPATVNLLLLNNRFAFNVKISVPGGLTTTIMIPANFNFRPFIKADGTMNIHDVLWSIVQKKDTRKGSIYMIRRE